MPKKRSVKRRSVKKRVSGVKRRSVKKRSVKKRSVKKRSDKRRSVKRKQRGGESTGLEAGLKDTSVSIPTANFIEYYKSSVFVHGKQNDITEFDAITMKKKNVFSYETKKQYHSIFVTDDHLFGSARKKGFKCFIAKWSRDGELIKTFAEADFIDDLKVYKGYIYGTVSYGILGRHDDERYDKLIRWDISGEEDLSFGISETKFSKISDFRISGNTIYIVTNDNELVVYDINKDKIKQTLEIKIDADQFGKETIFEDEKLYYILNDKYSRIKNNLLIAGKRNSDFLVWSYPVGNNLQKVIGSTSNNITRALPVELVNKITSHLPSKVTIAFSGDDRADYFIEKDGLIFESGETGFNIYNEDGQEFEVENDSIEIEAEDHMYFAVENVKGKPNSYYVFYTIDAKKSRLYRQLVTTASVPLFASNSFRALSQDI
jgi:hypothetical protein